MTATVLGTNGRAGLAAAGVGVIVAGALIGLGPRGTSISPSALSSSIGATPSLPGATPEASTAASLVPARVPTPGVYHFRTDTHASGSAIGGSTSRSTTTDLTIRQTANAGGDTSLQYSYSGPVQGSSTSTELWRTSGGYLISTDLGSNSCKYSPPVLQVPFPLATGRRWSSASACHLSLGLGSITIKTQSSGKVAGTTVVDVGGTSVPAWILDESSTSVNSADFRGASTGSVSNSHSEELFAPSLGLVVESRSVTASVQARGAKATSTTTSALLRVQPDPLS